MKRILSLLVILAIAFSPVEAASKGLGTKVNLSFYESSLSHVLLLLSKVSDTNIVLPSDLEERKTTVDLKNITALDAVKNVLALHNLKYILDQGSIKVVKELPAKAKFLTIDLKYTKAKRASEELNENVFRDISLLSDEDSINPYSLPVNYRNRLLVYGTEEHIEAAEEAIKAIDEKPNLEFYKLSHLKPKEAIKLLKSIYPHSSITPYRAYHNSYENISYDSNFNKSNKDLEKLLVIKGTKPHVEATLEYLDQYDIPAKEVAIETEVFLVGEKQAEKLENTFPGKELVKFNSEYTKTPDFQSIHSKLVKLPSIPLALEAFGSTALGTLDQYKVKLFGQEISYLELGDVVAYRTNLDKLVTRSSEALNAIKKSFKLKPNNEVLILVKPKI